ncbi:MAG: SRPBCC family protein [Verrucomicrobiales bacterium]|nr:SRPBCC family protein [Verrucomicrobiales bacterium]
MPLIELSTGIRAPIEKVFDLARSIDAHIASAGQTQERAIAGRTSGLIESGESVTWEARHFGVKQQLTVKITEMDFPHSFEDVMVKGAFASMSHRHEFEEADGVTVMRDRFEFSAPLGILGRLAEKLFLTAYMTRFLEIRNAHLKAAAEAA